MDSLFIDFFGSQPAYQRTASGLPSDLQWLVAVWFMIVGGCVGSLMNVIVYRWPAGMSIVFPGSRCPRCLHPIRLYDNVPVLSWLVLRARCRDCKLPIPVRYPAVETAVAVVFFALFVIEVIHGGGNLPAVDALGEPQSASLATTTREPGTLWGIFALHVLLCCTLICAALIEFDGRRLPAKLIWPPLLIAVLLTMFWPQLRPLCEASASRPGRWMVGVWESMAGIALAGIAGAIIDARLPTRTSDGRRTLSATGIAVVIGAATGWTAALQICAVGVLLVLAGELERRVRPGLRMLPVSTYLAIATLLFLLYWRLIGEHTVWLAEQGDIVVLSASLVVIAAAAVAAGRIRVNEEPL